jgi:hypothetical protein
MGLRITPSGQLCFRRTNVITGVQPLIWPHGQQRGCRNPGPASLIRAPPHSHFLVKRLCVPSRVEGTNFPPFFSPSSGSPEPPESERGVQVPSRRALPRGSKAPPHSGGRCQGKGVCALGRPRHPHSPHTQSPPGRTPPTLRPRPRPCRAPAGGGNEGVGRQEGCKSRSEPAVAVPRPCSAGARAHGTPQRAPAADAAAAAAAVAAAWLAAVVTAKPWSREERSSRGGRGRGKGGWTRSQPLAAPTARVSPRAPGPPPSAGQRTGGKQGSPAVRAALASAPVSPPQSAGISCGCLARASYLRAARLRRLSMPSPRGESRAGSGADQIPALQALAAAARRSGWRGRAGRGPRRARRGQRRGLAEGGGPRSQGDPCRQRLRYSPQSRAPQVQGQPQGGHR